MRSCSASSVEPGGMKFAQATFSVLPQQGAAAASRSSTAASSIVVVPPPSTGRGQAGGRQAGAMPGNRSWQGCQVWCAGLVKPLRIIWRPGYDVFVAPRRRRDGEEPG